MDGKGAVQIAPKHFPVERIEAGGSGSHDDRVRTQFRILHVGDIQHAVVAVSVGCYGSHRSTPSPGCCGLLDCSAFADFLHPEPPEAKGALEMVRRDVWSYGNLADEEGRG